jgi:hypothetical protein
MSRVVAAVGRDVEARLRTILPKCELRFVRTGAQLVRALDEAGCDLLIVGLHPDEWSAVAALEDVLCREQAFPVVCVRGAPSLGQPGGQNFIDLLQYADDALGNARVRAMLERLLPS